MSLGRCRLRPAASDTRAGAAAAGRASGGKRKGEKEEEARAD